MLSPSSSIRFFSGTVLCALLLVLQGCQQTIHFDTEAKGTATIEGNALNATLGTFPGIAAFSNIDFASTQDFRNNGVTAEDVKSVRLTRAVIRVISPSDADFDWLSSLRFSVEANGQPKRVVAFKENIQQLGLNPPFPEFELELADLELQPYVVAPAMAITTEGTGRTPPQDVKIEAVFTFGVDAFVSGAAP